MLRAAQRHPQRRRRRPAHRSTSSSTCWCRMPATTRRPVPPAAARARRPRRVPRVLGGRPTLRSVPAAVRTRVQAAAAVRPRDGVRPAVARRPHARTDRQPRRRGRRGPRRSMRAAGRKVLDGTPADGELDGLDARSSSDDTVVRWVRGVLERMRDRGAHRPRVVHAGTSRRTASAGPSGAGARAESGMPAFPPGATRPAFPRVGAHAPTGDDAEAHAPRRRAVGQSWYAIWATRRARRRPAADGAQLTPALLAELERDGVSAFAHRWRAATVYAYLPQPSRSWSRPSTARPRAGAPPAASCDVCQQPGARHADVDRPARRRPRASSARCPGRSSAAATRRTTTTARSTTTATCDASSRASTRACSTTRPGSRTRTGSRRRPTDPAGAERARRHADARDGHRHRRPVDRDARRAAPQRSPSYLQRVGRAGRLTGNALVARLRHRARRAAAAAGRSAVGDQRARCARPRRTSTPKRSCAGSTSPRSSTVAPPRRRPAAAGARRAEDARSRASFLGDAVADAERRTPSARRGVPRRRSPSLERERPSTRCASGRTRREEPGTSRSRRSRPRRRAPLERASCRPHAPRTTRSTKRSPDLEARSRPSPGATRRRHPRVRAARRRSRCCARSSSPLCATSYWIGALERFGLLPNYTLLDDSVRLDVAARWIDPDTSSDTTTAYSATSAAPASRSASSPPARCSTRRASRSRSTPSTSAPAARPSQHWTFCPACGFGYDASARSRARHRRARDAVANGIADAAQRLPVVELEERVGRGASRRGGHQRSQRRPAARARSSCRSPPTSIPARDRRRWYVEATGFGVTYLRDLTVRWLNLGKRRRLRRTARHRGRRDAGAAVPRVRRVRQARRRRRTRNNRREHGRGARAATRVDENTRRRSRSAARSRRRGSVLRLPPRLTLGDSLAVPSLSARHAARAARDRSAVIPTTCASSQIVEPVLSDGSENVPALLVHDTVPGGTGYLAELADRDAVRELLDRAWKTCATASASTRGAPRVTAACCRSRPAGTLDRVSRASARAKPRTCCSACPTACPPSGSITRRGPRRTASASRSSSSSSARSFMERAKALGGGVKEIPGDWGNKMQVSFPGDPADLDAAAAGSARTRPQPDFVLEQFGGGAKPIAIYTDGLTFHATDGLNRVRDDAEKRRGARDLGYHVMAITWEELERAATDAPEPAPDWFRRSSPQGSPRTSASRSRRSATCTANPITSSWSGCKTRTRPRRTGRPRAGAADARHAPSGKYVESGIRGLAASVLDAFDGGTQVAVRGHGQWHVRRPHLVWASASPMSTACSPRRFSLLDDRATAARR